MDTSYSKRDCCTRLPRRFSPELAVLMLPHAEPIFSRCACCDQLHSLPQRTVCHNNKTVSVSLEYLIRPFLFVKMSPQSNLTSEPNLCHTNLPAIHKRWFKI